MQAAQAASSSDHDYGTDDSLDLGGQLCHQLPRHHFFAEPEQYRVKVQRFSRLPCEVTIQRISFDRDIERYSRAAENGYSSCFPSTARRRDPDRLEPEDLA